MCHRPLPDRLIRWTRTTAMNMDIMNSAVANLSESALSPSMLFAVSGMMASIVPSARPPRNHRTL